MTLVALVEQFSENVVAQAEAIWRGNAKVGNRHAKRYIAALQALRAHGDAGRDAVIVLLKHPHPDVRVIAAAFLLRHRTVEAKAVLEEAARGKGLSALEAEETLKSWEEGTWNLDPA